MKTSLRLTICALSPLLLASLALGQQDYIGRYDVYAGYMYLNSPLISLGETGVHLQVGTNRTKWYSLGVDFSEGTGNTTLTPIMLKSSVQQLIASELGPLKTAGLLPSTYEPVVPLHSQSQTYSMGPQLNYRHFARVTLYIHPDVGAIHEATALHPNPRDPIALALVQNLAPSGTKEEYTCFYGVGGGVDYNVNHHFGVKLHVDFVHDHLFGDVLNGRNSVRISVGPVFHMGKNVAGQK